MRAHIPLMILTSALLVCTACEKQSPDITRDSGQPTQDLNDAKESDSATSGTASQELPGASIYQLDSSWTTQKKATFKLSDLQGKPVIMTMFFGSCRTACPTLIADMKRIEKQLGEDSNISFVLITFDPDTDTPEALQELETKFELDPKRWIFLHGDKGHIREVAAVLGVQYREVSDGQFTHTNRITVLNRDGVVVEKLDGLSQPIEPIVDRIKALQK